MSQILNIQEATTGERAKHAFAAVEYDYREIVQIPEHSHNGRVDWGARGHHAAMPVEQASPS